MRERMKDRKLQQLQQVFLSQAGLSQDGFECSSRKFTMHRNYDNQNLIIYAPLQPYMASFAANYFEPNSDQYLNYFAAGDYGKFTQGWTTFITVTMGR